MSPELRVFLLDDCLINPFPPEPQKAVPAGVLALFVPKLIEMGIGAVATLLKKAGAKDTTQAMGHASPTSTWRTTSKCCG